MLFWKKRKNDVVISAHNGLSRVNGADEAPNRQRKPSDCNYEQSHLGMFVLANKPSQNAKVVDIVAIHGLNGHYLNTWTEKTASGEQVNWLRDFLPKQIPSARIMSYGYNSAVQFSKSVADIGTFAEQLLNDLMSWRNSPAEKLRPIIFIFHSLGGIVFKQALNKANERERFADLLTHIRGVAFFGTPHRGADLAIWAKIFANILKSASLGLSTNTKLSKDLQKRSETLYQITKSFVERGKDLVIFSFYETDKMKMLNCRVVEEDSAVLGWANETSIAIAGDHRSICRFSAIDEPRYRNVWANIQSMTSTAIKKTLTEEEQACLLSLYTSDYEAHKNRNPKAVDGTCQWILRHEKYKAWCEAQGSSLLWISADAGCGKSVLVSFLASYLTYASARADTNICYFFFKDDVDEQKNAIFALSALLHQICVAQPTLLHHAMNQRAVKGQAMSKQFHSLWTAFTQMMSDSMCNDTICLIDGLDECEMRSRKELMGSLADLFGHKTQETSRRLKVIVTSRPDNSIKNAFATLPEIRLRGEDETKAINQDVKLVVQANVNNLEASGLPRELLKDLQQELIKRADRTFLWTTLTIELLKDASERSTSKEEIDSILKSDTINSIYNKLLEGRPEPDQAKKMLQIVVAAARPFTLEEMSIAIAVKGEFGKDTFKALNERIKHPFENYVKCICGHFLRIVHERIYLVHQTAREFLLYEDPKVLSPSKSRSSKPKQAIHTANQFMELMIRREERQSNKKPKPNSMQEGRNNPYITDLKRALNQSTIRVEHKRKTWDHSISLLKAHDLILNISVAYLYLFDDNDERIDKHHLKALLDYAATHWLSHLKVAKKLGENLSVSTEFYRVICDPSFKGFNTWTRLKSTYNLYFPKGRLPIEGVEPAREDIYRTILEGAPNLVDIYTTGWSGSKKHHGKRVSNQNEQQWGDDDPQEDLTDCDGEQTSARASDKEEHVSDKTMSDDSESWLTDNDDDDLNDFALDLFLGKDSHEIDDERQILTTKERDTHRDSNYRIAERKAKERDPLKSSTLLASHPPERSSFLNQREMRL